MTNIVLWELGESGIPGIESHSPFCLKVHRALKLAGLAYERQHVAMPMKLRHLNPAAQAPVLVADGQPIADSTAIVRWLDARVPGALLPVDLDARGRAEAWLWEEFADRALNNFVVAARWADDRNWPAVKALYFGKAPWFVRTLIAPRIRARVLGSLEARDVTRHGLDGAWRELERILDALEARAPERGFWLGTDVPTLADVALFAQLRSLQTPLTEPQARAVARRPRLDDWLDRVHAHTFEPATATAPAKKADARVARSVLAEARVA